ALYPKHIANIVTVKMVDGETFTERVDDAPGHVHNRLSDEQLLEKYHKLADPRLGAEQAKAVADWVWALDKQSQAGELVGMLDLEK
ncbi:MAG: MmgE/PrpD family protein, partial [Planctomycetota bacterium]